MDTKSYSCRSFIHPPRFHGLEQSSHYSGKKKKKREGVSFHLKLYQVLGLYLQLQVLTRVTPASRFGRGVTNTLRGLCLVMLPIASYAPAVSWRCTI